MGGGPIAVTAYRFKGSKEKDNGMAYCPNRSAFRDSAVFVLVDRLLRQDRN